jgi:hypothetical protein
VNLILTRNEDQPFEDRILGRLYIEGTLANYYTLELGREFEGRENVHEKTCIPEGRYKIELRMSPHFGRVLPHLLDVPGRTDILIHVANYPHDIKGCIGVGKWVNDGTGAIGKSLLAVQELMEALNRADEHGEEIWITIS